VADNNGRTIIAFGSETGALCLLRIPMFPKQGFMPGKKGGVIADYASTSVIHGLVSSLVGEFGDTTTCPAGQEGIVYARVYMLVS